MFPSTPSPGTRRSDGATLLPRQPGFGPPIGSTDGEFSGMSARMACGSRRKPSGSGPAGPERTGPSTDPWPTRRAGPGRCAAGCGWQGGQRRWALRRARQHLGMVLGLRGPRPVRRQADSSRRRLGRSGVEQPGVREPRQPTGRGAGGRRIQSRPRRGRPIRYPRGTGLVGRQRSAPGRHQRAPAHRLDAAPLTATPGPVAQKSPDTPVHGIQPGTTLG